MVSGSTSPNASKHVYALWINMREEPMLYINGQPFVLREEVRVCVVWMWVCGGGLLEWPMKWVTLRSQKHRSMPLPPHTHTCCVLQVRPLKNMMEYAGIDAQRIEAMEARMKKDVLAEVRCQACPPGRACMCVCVCASVRCACACACRLACLFLYGSCVGAGTLT